MPAAAVPLRRLPDARRARLRGRTPRSVQGLKKSTGNAWDVQLTRDRPSCEAPNQQCRCSVVARRPSPALHAEDLTGALDPRYERVDVGFVAVEVERRARR